MKKLITVMVAACMAFALFGCGGTQATTQSSANSSNTQAEQSGAAESSADGSSSALGALEWPENEITSQFPKPAFIDKITSVTVSDATVSVIFEGADANEVLAYVDEAKGLGFTSKATETKSADKYLYHAQNTEDYSGYDFSATYDGSVNPSITSLMFGKY